MVTVEIGGLTPVKMREDGRRMQAVFENRQDKLASFRHFFLAGSRQRRTTK